jgi:hypothetical protein
VANEDKQIGRRLQVAGAVEDEEAEAVPKAALLQNGKQSNLSRSSPNSPREPSEDIF